MSPGENLYLNVSKIGMHSEKYTILITFIIKCRCIKCPDEAIQDGG